MTAEELPGTVKIGPYNMSIVPMPPMEGSKWGNLGTFYSTTLTIEYRSDMPIQKTVATIVHEALHGMWFTSGLTREFDKDEEEHVQRLTHTMVDFIKDNPKFISWISQQMADETTTHVLKPVPVHVEP